MNIVESVTSKGIQYEIADTRARDEKLDKDELPKKLSAFINDIGLIDSTVSDLVNYYTKTETYTKKEIDEKINVRIRIFIVDELPTENIDRSAIYFVPRTPGEEGERDGYDEYIWVGDWELIGNTYVDLSDYYTKAETDIKIAEKVAEEAQARAESDGATSAEIDALKAGDESLGAEITREKNRAEYAELQLQNAIENSDASIEEESARAQTAENRLSDRLDAVEPHLSDKDNPHNVTKAQIGLGNVDNLATDESPTMNSGNNVSSGGVYDALENKVDKVTGKGLSDQNFTYEEKTKLANLSNYDDTAISERVAANEGAISTLNGDSSTAGSVDKKIADALENITGFDFQIVETLPESGAKGIIYLVAQESGTEKDAYEEFIWIGSAWEYLGKKTVTIDLSEYAKKTEVTAAVSVKMNKDNPTGTGAFSLNRASGSTIGENSFAEGQATKAEGFASHAEGQYTRAANYSSHAEGNFTEATGSFSHAENSNTTASGISSHAEGAISEATGDYSHAEGNYTTASGISSHAEGIHTVAGEHFTHAEGLGTIAKGRGAHSQGRYNIEDTSDTYADIVGGGESDAKRKNIEATTWDGDKRLKGDLFIFCEDDSSGGTSVGNAIGGTAGKNDKITVTDDATALTDSDSFDETAAGANPTATKRRLLSSLWTYIKGKIASVLGLTESNGTRTLSVTSATTSGNLGVSGILSVNGYQQKRYFEIDASSLSTSNFYPVTFNPTDLLLDCEIHSPNLNGSAAYNQNALHFQLMTEGWSDTPTRLVILHHGMYDANEITIGCIGRGNRSGGVCVWVRGGMKYRFVANQTPTLRSSDYTYDQQTYTVGTWQSGGTNTNVSVLWSPDTVHSAHFFNNTRFKGDTLTDGIAYFEGRDDMCVGRGKPPRRFCEMSDSAYNELVSGAYMAYGNDETGGLIAGGDGIDMWAPPDNDLVRFWNEDNGIPVASIDGYGWLNAKAQCALRGIVKFYDSWGEFSSFISSEMGKINSNDDDEIVPDISGGSGGSYIGSSTQCFVKGNASPAPTSGYSRWFVDTRLASDPNDGETYGVQIAYGITSSPGNRSTYRRFFYGEDSWTAWGSNDI